MSVISGLSNSAEMINYLVRQGNSETSTLKSGNDAETMFKNLTSELGLENNSFTKAQLEEYIKKVKDGAVDGVRQKLFGIPQPAL